MTSKDLMVVDNQVSSVAEFANIEPLINQWIIECDVQPLTAKSYHTAAKVFINWLISSRVQLSEVALIDYREWLKHNRSTSSAKLYFVICRKLTAWLAKRGYIAANYGDGLKGIKLDTSVHSRDSLTLEESVEVLDSMANAGDNEISLRNNAIMTLLICCGLRCCEVVRADVGDIEKRRGVWCMKVHGKARSGKNDSIVLPLEVKEVIDKYLVIRGKVKDAEPLFVSTSRRCKNQRLQTQTISRLAKRAFKGVGIESKRITCHSCRHTCATIALESGASLDEVSKNLRHKSVAVTEIYRHDVQFFTNKTTKTVAGVIFARLKGAKIYG